MGTPFQHFDSPSPDEDRTQRVDMVDHEVEAGGDARRLALVGSDRHAPDPRQLVDRTEHALELGQAPLHGRSIDAEGATGNRRAFHDDIDL